MVYSAFDLCVYVELRLRPKVAGIGNKNQWPEKDFLGLFTGMYGWIVTTWDLFNNDL